MTSPRKMILDTNVLVAAGFNTNSASARIIRRVRRGDCSVVWNEATREESMAVLEEIPPLSWGKFADLFREENRYAETTEVEDMEFVSDPADREFAALAEASGAVLMSKDRDQLRLIQGSFLELPLGSGTCDFAVAVMTLHHLLPERGSSQ